jgi:indolepyruvate ferredoxin oxidoreductase alpha subunit
VRLLGCPAILVIENEYRIDRNLCTGCHLCAVVCTRDAIHPIVEDLHEDAPTTAERLRT